MLPRFSLSCVHHQLSSLPLVYTCLAGVQAKDGRCAPQRLPYPSGPLGSLQPVSPSNPLSVTEGCPRFTSRRSLMKRMIIQPCTGRVDQHFHIPMCLIFLEIGYHLGACPPSKWDMRVHGSFSLSLYWTSIFYYFLSTMRKVVECTELHT